MMLRILTIVFNGMPFITWHLPILNRLRVRWHWHVVEGPVRNVHCDSWARPQPPGTSTDGTTEFLNSICHHPRVSLYRSMLWDGRIEMVNTPLDDIKEPCVLMQVDCDEIWKPEQLEAIVAIFDANPNIGGAEFFCRYFVGQNIIITSRNNTYGNRCGEWRRAWRYHPGQRFRSHAPPIMNKAIGALASREETERMGLVFDHYAYVHQEQVRYKERVYGYDGAVDGWLKLQANRKWPVRLSEFLPWVKDDATADLLHKL